MLNLVAVHPRKVAEAKKNSDNRGTLARGPGVYPSLCVSWSKTSLSDNLPSPREREGAKVTTCKIKKYIESYGLLF